MLWHKAWWEVRIRLLLAVALAPYLLYLVVWEAPPELLEKTPNLSTAELSAKIWKIFVLDCGGVLFPVSAKILAGAGINAQTSMGMARGFHGSMSFLLSLPVSRARLLAVRATAGAILTLLLGLATVAAFFVLAPERGLAYSVPALLPSLGGMLVVTAFFYAMAVLFTALFDEFWSGTLGLLILGMMLGYSFAGPSPLSLLSLMESPTTGPVLGYTLASLAMLYAAYRVVESKEY